METSGIDNIRLTAGLCERLYPQGITNLELSTTDASDPLPYKGGNKQNILIVIDTPGDLQREDQLLLDNLMKACFLSMDDVALINMSEQSSSFPDILQKLHIKKAILFGIPSLMIGLPIPASEESVIVYDNQYFLRTSPLSSLHHDVGKKRTLWKALKDLFNI